MASSYAVLLVAVAIGGNGLSSVAVYLPLLGVTNACVALMLWWAWTSIGRALPVA